MNSHSTVHTVLSIRESESAFLGSTCVCPENQWISNHLSHEQSIDKTFQYAKDEKTLPAILQSICRYPLVISSFEDIINLDGVTE